MQLGHYRVVSQLGKGGMAVVYRAYHSAMDRFVALKVLPPQLAMDPEFLGRFKQEARVIAGLQHIHILPVFDYGESEGYTYFVMPLIETGTLADLLQGKPLTLAETGRIIGQVGSALGHAHSRGLVHRDVKPSNILLDQDGNALLTDFGIAKIVEATTFFTQTGGIIGTPAYMSPEQIRAEPLDGRSDLYSLGIVLFEMTTGRPPFSAETPPAIFVKHLHDPLPRPRALNPRLPRTVEAVVTKALQKRPQDRFASAEQMIAALQEAIAPYERAGHPAAPRRTGDVSTAREESESVLPKSHPSTAGASPEKIEVRPQAQMRVPGTTIGRALSATIGRGRGRAAAGPWLLVGMILLAVIAGAALLLTRPGGAHLSGLLTIRPTSMPTSATASPVLTIAPSSVFPQPTTTSGVIPTPLATSTRSPVAILPENVNRIELLASVDAPFGSKEIAGLSPDCRRMALSGYASQTSEDSITSIIEIPTLADRFSLAIDSRQVAWSADGARIATVDAEQSEIVIWDTKDGVKVQSLSPGSSPLVWSPDGKKLAAGAGGRTLRIWNLEDGKVAFTIVGTFGYTPIPNWSPDGSRLVTTRGFRDWSGQVERQIVWDASSGEYLMDLNGPAGLNPVNAFWSPDGSRLISLYLVYPLGYVAWIWDADGGSLLWQMKTLSRALTWSPNGRLLAYQDRDGLMDIMDASTHEGLASVDVGSEGILSLCWTPDGTQIVSVQQATGGGEAAGTTGEQTAIRMWGISPGP